MSRDHKECPICKLEDPEVLGNWDYGDKVTYNCSRCGKFEISGTAESIAERKGKSIELSAWLRERNYLGIEIPMLTSDFLSEVVNTLPSYTVSEKQNKLLRAIEIQTQFPGDTVLLQPNFDFPLSWAANENEFRYYIRSMISAGYLSLVDPKRSVSDLHFSVVITSIGWEFLEKKRFDLSKKYQVFVAMSFDQSMKSIYDSSIGPAVLSTGYKPYRVDSEHHLDRIDAKIVAEIKESRFLIADVTQQKTGVYYEAGFAQGLGIPVIWTVRSDDLKNVHFDTRQFNHVVWSEEIEFKEKLADFILATIGRKNS